MNEEYPYKVKLPDPAPEGVRYPKAILNKAEGTFTKTTGMFKVPFVPTKAGSVDVSCVVSLSVCSENNCIMEKVPVSLTVAIK